MSNKRATHPVFVLITASNCGACKAMKANEWPALRTKLEQSGKFDIHHVDVGNMASPLIPAEYPGGLIAYTGWYPMLIIVPAAEWNAALDNRTRNTDLKAAVFNAQFVNGTLTRNQQYPRSAEGFYAWAMANSVSLTPVRTATTAPPPTIRPPVTTDTSNTPVQAGTCSVKIVPAGRRGK